MKHMMLDCYGANRDTCNDLKYIYNLLNEMAHELKLKPICPPQLVPYYYGVVPEDDGISAFLLLEGGHITLHAFPYRECYFIDLYSPVDFDDKILEKLLSKRLGYEEKLSIINVKDRNIESYKKLKYDPQKDFGPHILMKVVADKEVTYERIADFLENLVPNINMTPITRATVLKSSLKNPKYLSGIILIAQSHISFHYNYKTKEIFFDIFSCCYFDFSCLEGILGQFGEIKSYEVVARGTKHVSKLSKDPFNGGKAAQSKWLKSVE